MRELCGNGFEIRIERRGGEALFAIISKLSLGLRIELLPVNTETEIGFYRIISSLYSTLDRYESLHIYDWITVCGRVCMAAWAVTIHKKRTAGFHLQRFLCFSLLMLV